MNLTLWIGTFFIVAVGAAVFALLGTQESRQAARRPHVWLPLLLVAFVTVAGIVWEEDMLTRFARREGGTINGLIARPAPLTTDHRYTPNGRQYPYRGILIPSTVTCGLLAVIAFVFSAAFYAHEPGRTILALCLETLIGVAAVAIHSARRLIQAIDLFI